MTTPSTPSSSPESDKQKSLIEQLFGGKNRVAIVTGGTGALCGRMAQVLGESGYRVVVAGRSEEKGNKRVESIRDKGGEAVFAELDVTDIESFERLRDTTLETYGQIDVVVNGAGMNKGVPNILDFDPEDWDTIMNTNARSVFYSTKVFGEHFRKVFEEGNGGDEVVGNFVNVSSVSTPDPLSRVGLYSASKATVDSLTKSAATELAQFGVRVNAVRPGFFPAEQNAKVLDGARKESIARQTPVKRTAYPDCSGFALPEDLDATTLKLASKNATKHMTGETVTVDGGYSAFRM